MFPWIDNTIFVTVKEGNMLLQHTEVTVIMPLCPLGLLGSIAARARARSIYTTEDKLYKDHKANNLLLF